MRVRMTCRVALLIGLTILGTGLMSCILQRSSQPAVSLATPRPSWWNERVFYEVFVRSFYDSDGDGNGDLRGLIAQLDYLNDGDPATTDDLGVRGIWLMPIMQAASYHGYDATDYITVEKDYGSNQDFQVLIEEAHKRDIKVIIDLMLNHTSNAHPWFIAASGDPESEKRAWYIWRDDDPGHKAPWGTPVWFPLGDVYYHALFDPSMPDLNYRNDAVTAEMTRVAHFWLEKMGADGFRLDAVRHLIERDDVYSDTEETHAWLAQWNDSIDQIAPDALTIGEIWDAPDRIVPYIANDEVDLAFEFSLASGIIGSINAENPRLFADSLAIVLSTYPPGRFASFLTNHDQNRTMTQLAGNVTGARLAATILLTLPGVPFVYYGEEIGMTGQKPDEQIRTPMQWDAEPGAGFSNGTPWEPVNNDYAQVNVAGQTADPASLLNHYRRLMHLRNSYLTLQHGGLQSLENRCSATYAYLRHLPGAVQSPAILVVLNFSSQEQRNCAFDLDQSALSGGSYTAVDLLTGQPAAVLRVGTNGDLQGYVPLQVLAPQQGAVLLLEP